MDSPFKVKDAYKVHLKDFDGPLDLLLHLIKNAKLDIKDIFVSDITSQYLEYMGQVNDVDLERASEFLEIAATLLEMKSRSMLPTEREMLPEESGEGLDLIRRLEEYKLMKEAGERLQSVENVDRFYKQPDDSTADYRYILKSMTLEGLLDAFSGLLHKVEKERAPVQPKEIKKDRFTVAEKMTQIAETVAARGSASFFELFGRDYSRSEIITTFLALLELLKLSVVTAEQKGTYEDITISYAAAERPSEDGETANFHPEEGGE